MFPLLNSLNQSGILKTEYGFYKHVNKNRACSERNLPIQFAVLHGFSFVAFNIGYTGKRNRLKVSSNLTSCCYGILKQREVCAYLIFLNVKALLNARHLQCPNPSKIWSPHPL